MKRARTLRRHFFCAALAAAAATGGGTVRADGFADCLAQVQAPCFGSLARAEALHAIDPATGLGMLLEMARREYALGGDTAARELIQQAAMLLDRLAGLKADAGRTHIATSWAQLGDAGAASAVADNIKDADTRSLAFSILAGEAIIHGQRDKARQWLQEVMPEWRADLALILAAAHAEAGDHEAAVVSATAALAGGAAGGTLLSRFGEAIAGSAAETARFAAAITDARQLAAFQRGVASGLAAQGRLADAATAAATIREPTERQGALRAIAFAQLSMSDVDGALRTVAPVATSVPDLMEAAAIALVSAGRREAALALVVSHPPATADRMRRRVAGAVARDGDTIAALQIVAEMQEPESRPEAWNDIVEARIAANDKAGARAAIEAILANGAELQPMYYPEVRRLVVALAQLGDATRALALAHRLAYAGDRAHTLANAAAGAADGPAARILTDAAAWAADGLEEFARDDVMTKILRLRLRFDDRRGAMDAYAELSGQGRLNALVALAYPAQP